jgi:hypothetical protein
MRANYMLTLTADALTALPDFKLMNPPGHMPKLVQEIKAILASSEDQRRHTMSSLSTFDHLLERQTWATEWAQLFKDNSDLACMVEAARKSAGLSASAVASKSGESLHGTMLFGTRQAKGLEAETASKDAKPLEAETASKDAKPAQVDAAAAAAAAAAATVAATADAATAMQRSAGSAGDHLLKDLKAVPLAAISYFTSHDDARGGQLLE